MMSGLMNSKIAGRINEHTRKLTGGKTPEDILMDFEITLDYDYDAVVVLSDEEFEIVNQYVLEQNNPKLTERFQHCCEESLRRANKTSADTLVEASEHVADEDHESIHDAKISLSSI